MVWSSQRHWPRISLVLDPRIMSNTASFVLLLLTSSLRAQIPTAGQNSSLVGLREVALFVVGSAADSVLRNSVARDLRKVGIVVLADSAEIDPAVGGEMTLRVTRIEGNGRSDGELRLTVSQQVEVPRTMEVGRLPTWSYEILGRDIRDFRQWRDEACATAVEYFTTHWYYANAR